jgi:hypothetical protein
MRFRRECKAHDAVTIRVSVPYLTELVEEVERE